MNFTRIFFRTSLVLIASLLGAQAVHGQDAARLDENKTEFKVFPNPVFDGEAFVSLKGFQEKDLLVVVYDMLGKEIYSRVEISENDGFLFSIDSEGHQLHEGVYLIVASKNDVIFRQKLIVR